jgi:hypothetical protein
MIEFSGPRRSLVIRTDRIIDGSPLVACRAAQDGGVVSGMHLNDTERTMSGAFEQSTTPRSQEPRDCNHGPNRSPETALPRHGGLE